MEGERNLSPKLHPSRHQVEMYLKDRDITYTVYEHPAVFTVAEAEAIDRQIPALHTKNLFLTDGLGDYFLVCLPAQKRLDIKGLSGKLGRKKLSFAKSEELQVQLNLTPGSVSVFGMVNTQTVQLVLDTEVQTAAAVGFHPNINTATVVLDSLNFEKYLQSLTKIKIHFLSL